MDCLNLSQIFAYQDRTLKLEDQEKISAHLHSCSKCQKVVQDYTKIEKVFQQITLPPDKEIDEECYDDFQLNSYLEGSLSKKLRGIYHKHLWQCDQCLNRLIGLEDLFSELKSEGVIPEKGSLKNYILDIKQNMTSSIDAWKRFPVFPKPAWRWAFISIILIATVLFLYNPFEVSTPHQQTRDKISEELELVYPKGEVQSDEAIEFKWRPYQKGAYYNFILIDSQGNIVWEQQTTHTDLKLPPELNLQPSETYFWQVEAFDTTGISVLSEMKSFSFK